MKPKLFALAVILLINFSSCQKELSFDSSQTVLAETKYLTLGSWDSRGRPKYLVGTDVISPDLKSFSNNILPSGVDISTSHPEFLYQTTNADIELTKLSDVFVTYIQNGAGVTNTIAYYTYPTNKPPSKTTDIKAITYIFPNAGSGSTLEEGDKVKIGRFDAGTTIGFVLLQEGWQSATSELDNTATHFYSTDLLNPEPDPSLKKHAVLIKYVPENKSLIGFEDVDRTKTECDHDFNDVMFYVTLAP